MALLCRGSCLQHEFISNILYYVLYLQDFGLKGSQIPKPADVFNLRLEAPLSSHYSRGS